MNISPLLVLSLLLLRCRTTEADDGFVTTRGVQFLLNGSPFYGNGFNAYWLMFAAADPSQRPKVTSVFQDAATLGLTVARAWAFSDGGSAALQSSPGVYNEQMFQGLDFAISEAKKFNIKLILSLVNNYKDLGGKEQYVEWARSQGQTILSEDGFFTNPLVKTFYQNHIKTVVTRRNTVTGVDYKDDPTIMAWELMNEVRCPSDLSGKTVQEWVREMAAYVKSMDSKHLVEIGMEGFYGPLSSQKQHNMSGFLVGTDFVENNLVPNIDFVTVHSYPDQWLKGSTDDQQLSFLTDWMNVHIQDAQNILRKPLLFAEFGKSSNDMGYCPEVRDRVFTTVYSTVYSSASTGGVASGSLFWQLLATGMDNDRDGYEVVISESPSTAGLIAVQSQKLNKIRKMYVRKRSVGLWEKPNNHRYKRSGN